MMLMMLTEGPQRWLPALAAEAAGGGTKRDGRARVHTHADDAGQGGKGRRRDHPARAHTLALPCAPFRVPFLAPGSKNE